MTSEADRKDEPGQRVPPLFVSDRVLHQLMAPHMGWDAFMAQIKIAEIAGFPGKSTKWRGRNWEKVKKWVAKDEGISGNATVTGAQDGPEQFDNAPARKKARV